MTSTVLRRRQGAVPNAVLAMAMFLFTEVMFFCALISSYIVLRGQAGGWPPAGQPRLPLAVAAAATVPLLLSGVAVRRKAYLATLVLGGVFLAVQGLEWVALLGHGLTSSSSLYGALFHAVIGSHAVHVTVAWVVVFWGWRSLRLGRSLDEGTLRAVGMFWMFVVAVWPPLYVLVYLW